MGRLESLGDFDLLGVSGVHLPNNNVDTGGARHQDPGVIVTQSSELLGHSCTPRRFTKSIVMRQRGGKECPPTRIITNSAIRIFLLLTRVITMMRDHAMDRCSRLDRRRRCSRLTSQRDRGWGYRELPSSGQCGLNQCLGLGRRGGRRAVRRCAAMRRGGMRGRRPSGRRRPS